MYFHHTLGKDRDNVGGKCGYSSKTLCNLFCTFGHMCHLDVWHIKCQSVLLNSLPADGLLLISDTCLPECPVGLLQAEGDGPL